MAQGIQAIVEALYDRLLLRDIFGKIVPGATLLGANILPFTQTAALPPRQDKISLLSLAQDLPTGGWLLFIGLAWLAGFAVQAFGEFFDLIRNVVHRQHLWWWQSVGRPNRELDRWYLIYRQVLGAPDAERLTHERFVVIQEACGNMFVALLLSIPSLLSLKPLCYPKVVFPLGTAYFIVMMLLYTNHFVHLTRRREWLNVIFQDSLPAALGVWQQCINHLFRLIVSALFVMLIFFSISGFSVKSIIDSVTCLTGGK